MILFILIIVSVGTCYYFRQKCLSKEGDAKFCCVTLLLWAEHSPCSPKHRLVKNGMESFGVWHASSAGRALNVLPEASPCREGDEKHLVVCGTPASEWELTVLIWVSPRKIRGMVSIGVLHSSCGHSIYCAGFSIAKQKTGWETLVGGTWTVCKAFSVLSLARRGWGASACGTPAVGWVFTVLCSAPLLERANQTFPRYTWMPLPSRLLVTRWLFLLYWLYILTYGTYLTFSVDRRFTSE